MSVALGELWRMYRKEPTDARFEAIVDVMRQYIFGMAGKILRKYPMSIDIDDLYSGALLGLFQAVCRFKPRMGASFKTFATCRIAGAMRDEIRRLDYLPRGFRKTAGKIQRLRSILREVNGCESSIKELAWHLGISVRRCQEVIDAEALLNKHKWRGRTSREMAHDDLVRAHSEKLVDPFAQARYEELVDQIASFLDER